MVSTLAQQGPRPSGPADRAPWWASLLPPSGHHCWGSSFLPWARRSVHLRTCSRPLVRILPGLTFLSGQVQPVVLGRGRGRRRVPHHPEDTGHPGVTGRGTGTDTPLPQPAPMQLQSCCKWGAKRLQVQGSQGANGLPDTACGREGLPPDLGQVEP